MLCFSVIQILKQAALRTFANSFLSFGSCHSILRQLPYEHEISQIALSDCVCVVRRAGDYLRKRLRQLIIKAAKGWKRMPVTTVQRKMMKKIRTKTQEMKKS